MEKCPSLHGSLAKMRLCIKEIKLWFWRSLLLATISKFSCNSSHRCIRLRIRSTMYEPQQCWNMYVWIYIYMYIYIACVYIYIAYIYIYSLCVYIYIHIYIYIYGQPYVYVCLYTCIHMACIEEELPVTQFCRTPFGCQVLPVLDTVKCARSDAPLVMVEGDGIIFQPMAQHLGACSCTHLCIVQLL